MQRRCQSFFSLVALFCSVYGRHDAVMERKRALETTRGVAQVRVLCGCIYVCRCGKGSPPRVHKMKDRKGEERRKGECEQNACG